MLTYGTLTDFQPEAKIIVASSTNNSTMAANPRLKPLKGRKLSTDSLTLVNWNIGFGGLGERANFFYDAGGFFFAGGKMVRSPKEDVDYYLKGIDSFLLAHKEADFILLQEIDSAARRSYYIDQLQRFSALLPEHNYAMGVNFSVGFVPLPIAQPWNSIGNVYSGIATYSKYDYSEVVRYQYPGEFSWPMRIFNLDRCMLVHRIPTTNASGKELIIINTHNSAYDADGSLRRVEMGFLRDFVQAEYAKGNYVIAGGDWNQCPPNFAFNKFRPAVRDSSDYPGSVSTDFLPADWTWAQDTTQPTNRKLYDVFNADTTFYTLIDYYLLSPNVALEKIHTPNLQFRYSDHQPNVLVARLKEF
jgi:endonuclease/exonuclease/phosphatase family metal-dependent hydrolase